MYYIIVSIATNFHNLFDLKMMYFF